MSTKYYNNPDLKDIRRRLRNDMPKPELVLWYHLKGKQFMGCKFRRQYGFGKYIVDFYCRELRLVIEVDGDSHYNNDENPARDEIRNQILKTINVLVLRFTNTEIMTNLEGVLGKLAGVVMEGQAFTTPSNSPL